MAAVVPYTLARLSATMSAALPFCVATEVTRPATPFVAPYAAMPSSWCPWNSCELLPLLQPLSLASESEWIVPGDVALPYTLIREGEPDDPTDNTPQAVRSRSSRAGAGSPFPTLTRATERTRERISLLLTNRLRPGWVHSLMTTPSWSQPCWVASPVSEDCDA